MPWKSLEPKAQSEKHQATFLRLIPGWKENYEVLLLATYRSWTPLRHE